MRRTRVVVVNVGGMLKGIIAGVIKQQPDMTFVGECADFDDLSARLRSTRPDCVVADLTGQQQLPEACMHALRSIPELRVLAIRGDGELVQLYEMRPEATDAGELSIDLLLRLIRGSSQPRTDATTALRGDTR